MMFMKKIIAIRHENKYEMERRVPIIPDHIGTLIKKGYEIHVQSSAKRVFRDYRAIVNNDIRCRYNLWRKEIPCRI